MYAWKIEVSEARVSIAHTRVGINCNSGKLWKGIPTKVKIQLRSNALEKLDTQVKSSRKGIKKNNLNRNILVAFNTF